MQKVQDNDFMSLLVTLQPFQKHAENHDFPVETFDIPTELITALL